MTYLPSIVCGVLTALIATGITLLINLVFPSTDLWWAVQAVAWGAFFSGFFAYRSGSRGSLDAVGSNQRLPLTGDVRE